MSKILSERTKFKLGCNDKIGFQFIPDPKIHMFFDKGTRGRIFDISNRHSKIDNKYLKKYD